jgi:hypothetical protein
MNTLLCTMTSMGDLKSEMDRVMKGTSVKGS